MKCPYCMGEGEIQVEENGEVTTVECEECDGYGIVPGREV